MADMTRRRLQRVRRWVARHPIMAAALIGVVVFAVSGAINWLLLRRIDQAAVNAAITAFLHLGIPVFLAVRKQERARIRARDGVIQGAIRYPGSRPGSLADIWNPGEAQVHDAGVVFQPRQDMTGTPIGRPIHFTITGVDGADRKPVRWDRKRLLGVAWPYPQQILTLFTDKGAVEFAVATDIVDVFLERLNRGPRDGPLAH